ncbi:MAG: 16S rRNA (guanine(527)-N(7))-methyltransferase RsmG [Cytophagales bacterium]|nr:16S rRNA (guanine(527)-N(7))-methyltransferase RsmG [Cytophagales bacterium]
MKNYQVLGLRANSYGSSVQVYTEKILSSYFSFSSQQRDRFRRIFSVYDVWNRRLNLVSRKDFSHLYLHHVLHSLALGRILCFLPSVRILDLGTGGGFPGIPLAIFYPDIEICLLDAVGKKIRAVRDIVGSMGLENVAFHRGRVEDFSDQGFDYVLGRAVTDLVQFASWARPKLRHDVEGGYSGGILYYTGGLREAVQVSGFSRVQVFELSEYFRESYFQDKQIVYLS